MIRILTSIIGSFFVKLGKSKNIMNALYKGLIVAGIVSARTGLDITKKEIVNRPNQKKKARADLGIFQAHNDSPRADRAEQKETEEPEHFDLSQKRGARTPPDFLATEHAGDFGIAPLGKAGQNFDRSNSRDCGNDGSRVKHGSNSGKVHLKLLKRPVVIRQTGKRPARCLVV